MAPGRQQASGSLQIMSNVRPHNMSNRANPAFASFKFVEHSFVGTTPLSAKVSSSRSKGVFGKRQVYAAPPTDRPPVKQGFSSRFTIPDDLEKKGPPPTSVTVLPGAIQGLLGRWPILPSTDPNALCNHVPLNVKASSFFTIWVDGLNGRSGFVSGVGKLISGSQLLNVCVTNKSLALDKLD